MDAKRRDLGCVIPHHDKSGDDSSKLIIIMKLGIVIRKLLYFLLLLQTLVLTDFMKIFENCGGTGIMNFVVIGINPPLIMIT